MDIPGLTRRQMADLGREIGKAGYPGTSFHHEELDRSIGGRSDSPGIVHSSGAWFAFGRFMRSYAYSDALSDEGFAVAFAPGSAGPTEERGPLEWHEVLATFAAWLGYLYAELSALDFASAVAEGVSLRVADTSVGDDAVFTPQERTELDERLQRIETELVKAAAQRTEDAQDIRRGFADLREELGRMRKGRWRNMLLGTVTSLVAKRAVSSDAARHVFDVVAETVTDWAHRLNP